MLRKCGWCWWGGEVGRSYAEIVEGEGMGRGADAWRRGMMSGSRGVDVSGHMLR